MTGLTLSVLLTLSLSPLLSVLSLSKNLHLWAERIGLFLHLLNNLSKYETSVSREAGFRRFGRLDI